MPGEEKLRCGASIQVNFSFKENLQGTRKSGQALENETLTYTASPRKHSAGGRAGALTLIP